jgi:hypothetical protein
MERETSGSRVGSTGTAWSCSRVASYQPYELLRLLVLKHRGSSSAETA